MPDAAQYTLSLFDTSALGWTVAAPIPDAEPLGEAHEEPTQVTPPPDARSAGVNRSA
ncbi:MAG TPA: hypothetical protein VKI44_26460 [Acetobacteraceae bacterium]|nr:hypothetical protein [Acetobacteraceae bacterium]